MFWVQSVAMSPPEEFHHELSAGPEDAGRRLDQFLAAALPELSRSRLKSLIQAGRLTSGGATITEPSYRVKPGQAFALRVPAPRPATPKAQAIALDILYEDDDLVVIDKPAGLVVHPAPGNPDATLVNALIAHCGDSLSGIGGVQRPGIVHRLDKETSGLLVAAKNDAAHAGLARQFADRSLSRVYLALVWGVPRPREGEIAGNIGRHPTRRKQMAVLRRGGRPALTRYRVVEVFGDEAAAAVECRLATGRTHQIRVHLAWRGHGVIGDPVYGGRRRKGGRGGGGVLAEAAAAMARQALHARALSFRHPRTGETMRFESPLPADMADLVAALRG